MSNLYPHPGPLPENFYTDPRYLTERIELSGSLALSADVEHAHSGMPNWPYQLRNRYSLQRVVVIGGNRAVENYLKRWMLDRARIDYGGWLDYLFSKGLPDDADWRIARANWQVFENMPFLLCSCEPGEPEWPDLKMPSPERCREIHAEAVALGMPDRHAGRLS